MAQTQLTLSWDECDVYARKVGDAKFKKFPTPVEESTSLTPTAGEVLEAKVEGGGVEARKQKKNSYELVFKVRVAPERTDPFNFVDGSIDSNMVVAVVPKNKRAKGIMIDNATASVLDNIYTSKDGLVDEYHFNALIPDSGNIVKRGIITATGDDGAGYQLQIA